MQPIRACSRPPSALAPAHRNRPGGIRRWFRSRDGAGAARLSFAGGGNFSAALAYSIAAGDVAERHGANEEAVAHFRSARKLTDGGQLPAADHKRKPEILINLSNAQMQILATTRNKYSVVPGSTRRRLALDQQDEAAIADIQHQRFCSAVAALTISWKSGRRACRGQPDRLRRKTYTLWIVMASASCHIGDFAKARYLRGEGDRARQSGQLHTQGSLGGADPAMSPVTCWN